MQAEINKLSTKNENSFLLPIDFAMLNIQDKTNNDTSLIKHIKFAKQAVTDTVIWFAEFNHEHEILNKCENQNILLESNLLNACSKRQAEFLASRQLAYIGLLQTAKLGRYVGRCNDGLPIWPKGIQGSISHHRNKVVVILGKGDQKLGIDIESPLLGISLKAIRNRVLSKYENRLVSIYYSNHESLISTLIFSAKESIYKAVYPESTSKFDIRVFELTSIPENGELTFRLLQPLSKSLKKGYRFIVNYSILEEMVITWISFSPADPK
ncbi:4'-phosphopantetheinyl transferase family protein [Vibrio cholerae]|uniref:4'-phosphopantetheinyl transferase family protein n=1 Tax=Vibrio cholerae TaxID=666 RepID=UPI00293467AC|nr:4'-phosphopantetheinyl transferase superfamily protein [Vibrio cholerae]MDV2382392.1 4'-phosphopantetheinyl transferase superfamily protein [Vibrio cholerae]HDI3197776.1 4'-phosphopantetheinyl transferase superfamily protein [Vibrio cholerae]HDI3200957.1 4'-phosphopantetheinyl transferase superfamily protein [Vibrio cholerae]HDI3321965.1 4'-phosphopantetheinyl transferase superfamily protein [Vibrio cholerae]